MTEAETVATWFWIIRMANGDWLTFVCLGAMFLRHPGRDVAEWN